MANGLNIDRVVSAGRVPGPDRNNTTRDFEVRYWTARLGCSADELRAAIRVVGNSIERVRAYVYCRRALPPSSLHFRGALES